MNRALRENLELNTDVTTPRVQCVKCGFVFGDEEGWKLASHRKLVAPTQGGPLMKDLEGEFLLEQLFCPQCKTLLNSEIVQVEP